MRFYEVLSRFFDELCRRAAAQEHPEVFLTKDYMAESFLSCADRWGEDDEKRDAYEEMYEEERKNDTYEDLSEFIYTYVLSLDRKRDVRAEYLRLKEEGEELLHLLKSKKADYEAQLKKIGKNMDSRKGKTVYYKQIVEERLKDAEEKTKPEELIRNAINNCGVLQFLLGFPEGFTRDILFVKNLERDKRYYIHFGKLPIKEGHRMIQLKETDKNAYLNEFEKMIFSLKVPDHIREIVKSNECLKNRERIFSTAMDLFCGKDYESFVYLMVPQIEGLLRVYLRLFGDLSAAVGILCITKKIREKDDFPEFVYFAYDFADLRNQVAHGEMVKVDRELAFEVLMDAYWLIGEIAPDHGKNRQS